MPLESWIEGETSRILRMLGCRVRKDGQEGWPDKVVYVGGGRHFWIEFKQPGQKPRPNQELVHAILRESGDLVLVLEYVPSVEKLSQLVSAVRLGSPVAPEAVRLLCADGARKDRHRA